VLCIYLHPVCVCIYIYIYMQLYNNLHTDEEEGGRDKHYQMEGRLDNIRNMED